MGFNKKTVKDVELKGKRVLLRADYNVPVEKGVITDNYRIKKSLPTIKYILEQGASLVIVSHLGRPEGKANKDYSLWPVAKELHKLVGKEVSFGLDCIGEQAKRATDKLKPGQVVLLENLRFHEDEEKNDKEFAKALAENSGAELFVQDGFGVVHRAHASTDAITEVLPSVAGLLLAEEVQTINGVMEKPEQPLVAVIGGAKIADKIEILNRLMETADMVAVGGAMANDFILAEGLHVGKSLVDKGSVGEAHEIMDTARKIEKQRAFSFLVPVDVVVSSKIDGRAATRLVDIASHTLADIQSYPKKPLAKSYSVLEGESILDIGPISAGMIVGAIKLSKTVIWNGTLGVTETKGIAGAEAPFSHATKMVAEAIIGDSRTHANKSFSVVGGGDTVGWIEGQGLVDDFSFVSTGGGASLELMSGHKLPGVESLLDRNS